MLIDWFTVGAQALNFIVLVWLMKHFLYQPVLDAIDAREKHIASELADADSKKTEAQKQSDDFKHKNDDLDRHRASLLKKATDDANGERERLLAAAHKAADALTAKRAQTLTAAAANLDQALRERTQQEVFAIARKTLADLASAKLEESMCEVFVGRMHALEGAEKKRLDAAFGSARGPLVVRSAFELPAPQRAAVQKAVHQTFSTKAALKFETAPNLVGGIELGADGHKLAWTISDYLTSLERGVGELLQSAAVPEVAPKKAAKEAEPKGDGPKAAPVAVVDAVAEPAST